jgi:hypothetical protein
MGRSVRTCDREAGSTGRAQFGADDAVVPWVVARHEASWSTCVRHSSLPCNMP